MLNKDLPDQNWALNVCALTFTVYQSHIPTLLFVLLLYLRFDNYHFPLEKSAFVLLKPSLNAHLRNHTYLTVAFWQYCAIVTASPWRSSISCLWTPNGTHQVRHVCRKWPREWVPVPLGKSRVASRPAAATCDRSDARSWSSLTDCRSPCKMGMKNFLYQPIYKKDNQLQWWAVLALHSL